MKFLGFGTMLDKILVSRNGETRVSHAKREVKKKEREFYIRNKKMGDSVCSWNACTPPTKGASSEKRAPLAGRNFLFSGR